MVKILSKAAILSLLLISFISLQSCGDDNNGNGNGSSDERNSDLLIKDDKGERVKLIIKPEVGDTMRYKMVALTTSTEKSPATGDQELLNEQEMTYYFTQVVDRIEESNIITYKMRYDSIGIRVKLQAGDSVVSEQYSSNVKDSIYNLPDYIQYNSSVAEDFYVRVSGDGEISDVYGLEGIYDNIFETLGDTLSEESKAMIKQSMGKESIKQVVQQQFQMFPDHEVYKDSSWTRSYETSLLVFPIKNILTYKLTDLKEEDGHTILTIDASLATEFISKEQNDQKLKLTVENSKTGGTGTIVFDLTRGCIKSKKTHTDIEIDMKMSAGGQSANALQTAKTDLTVELL